MKRKFYILLFLVFAICSVSFLWWNQAKKAADPTNKQTITFTIKRGEAIRSIAERLQKSNLIRSPIAFFLIARFGGYGSSIQAGEFRLKPSMDLYMVMENLTHGTTDIWIVIPEGWRNEEIALKLTQELSLPEDEFLKVAQQGYMFPDSYLIPRDATAGAVANIFLSNFKSKVGNDIILKAKERGLSEIELITIASLIEREARFDEDRPLVASVILNRLALGMKLDIDATIQYALGYQADEKTWWKKDLTSEDLTIDSPYNTYKVVSLPPGPIANPGLFAIKAVINAPKTNYLYYLSDKTGKLHFATTIEEHNVNVAKYLNR